jgi:predicted DNA-binding protein YlxM (UPF0122 family)
MVMTPVPKISSDKLNFVRNLYLDKKLSIREISEYMNVSADAVESFVRRHKIPKRSYSAAQQAKFFNKPLTFKKQKLNTGYLKELAMIGTSLYWAEGFKGDETNKTVDFANSDPLMIQIFLNFLRSVYKPDEKKMRVYLYCYSDQNVTQLIGFWSKVTKISKAQFLKPYIRTDFKVDGRKMKHGMIHVRYHDKKLLLDIKSMIQSIMSKYAWIV